LVFLAPLDSLKFYHSILFMRSKYMRSLVPYLNLRTKRTVMKEREMDANRT